MFLLVLHTHFIFFFSFRLQSFFATEVGVPSNGDGGLNPLEGALIKANSLLEKEEQDLEGSISEIAEVQVRGFHSLLQPLALPYSQHSLTIFF